MKRLGFGCAVLVALPAFASVGAKPATRPSESIAERLDRIEQELDRQYPQVQLTIEQLQEKLRSLQETLKRFPGSDPTPFLAPLDPRPGRPEPAPLLVVPKRVERI